MKVVFGVIGIVVGTIALAFCLELGGVAWFGFFEPMKENVRREVFENTKSYVHGKIQDLAKLYREYQSSEDRGALEAVVRSQFAELDANHIQSHELRRFLTNVRGY
jgi:hypothetical protein